KITTYRKLAEDAMDKILPFFPGTSGHWTAGVALPGGDFAHDGFDTLVAKLRADYDFLDPFWGRRLMRAYGTDAWTVLGDAETPDDLGTAFGATLTAREISYLMAHEYARNAEDVVWRRNKLGLRLDAGQIAALETWMQAQAA
ncbi:MAG: glycerol-3-phosphate dehydrogenase C-terminal domain-containing protein, partial [Pseudomonadota bacterium]